VLVISLPNIVDPVTYSILDVITCATIVWAVKVPLTVKSSAEDAVNANDEVFILSKPYGPNTFEDDTRDAVATVV